MRYIQIMLLPQLKCVMLLLNINYFPSQLKNICFILGVSTSATTEICYDIVKHSLFFTTAKEYLSSFWVPLSYMSFQPVLHDWCNKGHGMCYPVCGMVHIKEPLLLIGKSSLCGGSGFPFSLSEWSLTICLTPYNRK